MAVGKVDARKIKESETLLKLHNYSVMKDGYIKCNMCGKPKNVNSNEYFMSSSPLHSGTEVTYKDSRGNMRKQTFAPICKTCISGIFDIEKKDRVLSALRALDKPFINNDWQGVINSYSGIKNDSAILGYYIKNISLNYKDSVFADSEEWIDTITDSNNSNKKEVILSKREKKESIEDWGEGFSDTLYDYLNSEMLKLTASFECPDYGMKMLMKDICWINKDIKLAKEAGQDISKLIKTRSELMNDAKMKPIQATGADENDKVTFGTLIKKWENEDPVPQPLDDEMKRYIDLYMIGHLGKMQGLNNEMTKKYEQSLDEFTIDFEEVSMISDEDEDDE